MPNDITQNTKNYWTDRCSTTEIKLPEKNSQTREASSTLSSEVTPQVPV